MAQALRILFLLAAIKIFVVVLLLGLWLVPAEAATSLTGPIVVPFPCGDMPALTGAITSSLGSCATSGAMASPTRQVFTSGSGATYTTPSGAAQIVATVCGGGGGGGGSGATTGPNGTAGNDSIFNGVHAAGGGLGNGVTSTTAGTSGSGGTGGTGSATYRIAGSAGLAGVGAQIAIGPAGGLGYLGTYGQGGQGAKSTSTSRATGGAGGGGECFVLVISNPASTYTYTVGASASGGVGTGTGAASGGAGSAGFIQVDEYYGVVNNETSNLISTQTASASASLQFSGTKWSSSYNTLELVCSQLLDSNSSANLYLYVGEGGGPTWETASTYTSTGFYTAVGSSTVNGGSSTTDTDFLSTGTNATSTTEPLNFVMYFYGPASTTIYKKASMQLSLNGGTEAHKDVWWNADTNPITGLELIPSAGTITSGTCSLYGVN